MLNEHPLLSRQLRKSFGEALEPRHSIEPFLTLVDAAYCQQDTDRRLLEHTLDVVSKELTERNFELVEQLRARQQMEIELTHALKLEAVGQLAGNIAHEINTPIQYIGDSVGYVHEAFAEVTAMLAWYRARMQSAISGERLPTLSEIADIEESTDVGYAIEQIPLAVERTLDGVNRVATLVRAMKAFAHPDASEKVMSDLNTALRSTLQVALGEIRHVAEVQMELQELPMVPCHLGEINQVFLNLLINSAHAISDAGRGRGCVTVRSRVFGDSVEFSVSDTGNGIPEGVRDRIFEPFFTTKEVGRGTGQGLAIARTIVVEKHAGKLFFETTPEVGTTFFVRIPLAAPA
ncbi:MAG: HAMP domain-containing sensor histidine kinase [Gemmatimonadaceae bacterium]